MLDKMNLQLFAEEPTETADTEQPVEAESTKETEKTFTQADIDRIFNQRLARYKRDEEKRITQAREEGRSEAEKLAKMTEAERIEHAKQQAEEQAKARLADLERREAEISKRELMAGAATALNEKGLPSGLIKLIEMVSVPDAESYANVIKVIDETWRASVQEGVEARMNKNTTTIKRGSSADQILAQQMRKAAGLTN